MLTLFSIGAINALQDAVVLANCIYDIASVTSENIHDAFADYRSQRYPKAKYQMDKSKVMATIQYGQVTYFLFLLYRGLTNNELTSYFAPCLIGPCRHGKTGRSVMSFSTGSPSRSRLSSSSKTQPTGRRSCSCPTLRIVELLSLSLRGPVKSTSKNRVKNKRRIQLL